MWTSVSGLLVHGEKMNVIGNNISNVNTVGFKAQRMDFQDYVYQYIGTASGMGQVGRGTTIGIIMNDFDQGALETTTSDTDIAITGNGFFAVKPKTNNTTYYTRAGNFTFDKDGYLVSPHGYVLQGWNIDRDNQNTNSSLNINRDTGGIIGTGAPTDIRLDTFTCPPRHTTEITLPINLKAEKAVENDKSTDTVDPFFSLLKRWNASDPKVKPLGDNSYAYQSTMEVFDEGGKSHKLTFYFDRVTDGTGDQHIVNNTPSESYWEYIVTMDPADDVRDFATLDPNALSTNPNVPDKLKGLLGAGTLTFDSTGAMKDMSFFVPDAGTTGTWWTGAPGSETVDLSKFVSAPISEDGFPLVAPNFSGAPGRAGAYGLNSSNTYDYTQPNQYANGRLIALDFGLRTTNNNWNFPATMPVNGLGGMANHSATAFETTTPVTTTTTTTTTRAIAPPWINDGTNWVPDPLNPPAGMTFNGVDWNAATGLTPDSTLWAATGGGTYVPVVIPNTSAQPVTETVTITTTVTTIEPAAVKQYGFGMDGKSELLPTNMTCLDGAFFEHPGKRQDGYTYGDLRYVNVSNDGVLSAAYSNGVTLQLFQLTLYDFPSKQNLRREGGNLFTETRESGIPSSGAAGTGVFGTTQGRSLEQSNADIAREFVNMITTQRGFQANSKSITTVDSMLETVIQMKR